VRRSTRGTKKVVDDESDEEEDTEQGEDDGDEEEEESEAEVLPTKRRDIKAMVKQQVTRSTR